MKTSLIFNSVFFPLRVHQGWREARYTVTRLLFLLSYFILFIQFLFKDFSYYKSSWALHLSCKTGESLLYLINHLRSHCKCMKNPVAILLPVPPLKSSQWLTATGGVWAQLSWVLKSPLHSHPSTRAWNAGALRGTPRCSVETGEAERMGYTPFGKVRKRLVYNLQTETL